MRIKNKLIKMRDGHQVSVTEVGFGKPVLLLHGFGMNANHWLPVVMPLSFKYKFILPDFRGFGKSHHLSFNDECAVTNMAHDVQDILENLKIEDVTLGGISMGALVSLQYIKFYGTGRLNRYLHMDQSPYVGNKNGWNYGLFGQEHVERMEKFAYLRNLMNSDVLAMDFKDVPEDIKFEIWNQFGLFFSSSVRGDREWERNAAKLLFQFDFIRLNFLPTENWTVYFDCLKSYIEQDYDMRDVLPKIDIPVCLFVGRQSVMYPPEGQFFMAENLKNAKVEVFEKSGHTLFTHEPITFIKKLNQFLA